MGKKLDYDLLNKICDRAFFQALQMIHVANHRPQKDKGEPKVGGHASASASSQHILAALHLVVRQPEDYFACKPHVSPMDHAFNYLLHNFRDKSGKPLQAEQREIAMRNLRHYSPEGEPVFQSYHAEADPDSYRYFPSGSVGIPPVVALYSALGYQYAKDHGYELDEDPMFWCLMGDSEFREGSLAEAMPDAGERELKRVVWIVDYNRQNLDGTRIANERALRGSDADRMARIAEANGWSAKILKHGKLRERLFATSGGEEFRRVLDEEFTDFEFQSLLEANRPELTRSVLEEKSAKLKEWMKGISTDEIHRAYFNLGGHDLETLVETFRTARESDRPTFVAAYTIKGFGLRCQALSGNHSTLPEEDELKEMAERLGVSWDKPFASFGQGTSEESYLAERRKTLVTGIEQVLKRVKARQDQWLEKARAIDWPTDFGITAIKFNPVAHTQWMWGQVAAKLDRLGNAPPDEIKDGMGWEKVARHFLTMAPDVGTSTNTSPNMNGKLYGVIGQDDFEKLFDAKDKKAPDVVPKLSSETGHIRFEIAEGNCMSAAGAFGKFFHFTGLPFYPAMTIYDFFIKRAHDQFYYNLYWRSAFATLGTPSGVTLAPEGAQHSWKSDFQIPHCVTWEPCFAKELEWILADTLRRHFTKDDEERESSLFRCVTKGIVQKTLPDRLRRQARFKKHLPEGQRLSVESEGSVESVDEDFMLEAVRQDTLQGGYALVDYRGYEGYVPGDNVVHIFAMGALVPEAVKASDDLMAKGVFANVFVTTSPDLLLGNFAYHDGYRHLKEGLGVTSAMHFTPGKGNKVESLGDWYSLRGSRVPIVSVHDGEPGLLDNIGSAVGVIQEALAVRKTSKSGTTAAIFHFHGIDAEAIAGACERVLEAAAEEEIQVSGEVLKRL